MRLGLGSEVGVAAGVWAGVGWRRLVPQTLGLFLELLERTTGALAEAGEPRTAEQQQHDGQDDQQLVGTRQTEDQRWYIDVLSLRACGDLEASFVIVRRWSVGSTVSTRSRHRAASSRSFESGRSGTSIWLSRSISSPARSPSTHELAHHVGGLVSQPDRVADQHDQPGQRDATEDEDPDHSAQRSAQARRLGGATPSFRDASHRRKGSTRRQAVQWGRKVRVSSARAPVLVEGLPGRLGRRVAGPCGATTRAPPWSRSSRLRSHAGSVTRSETVRPPSAPVRDRLGRVVLRHPGRPWLQLEGDQRRVLQRLEPAGRQILELHVVDVGDVDRR